MFDPVSQPNRLTWSNDEEINNQLDSPFQKLSSYLDQNTPVAFFGAQPEKPTPPQVSHLSIKNELGQKMPS